MCGFCGFVIKNNNTGDRNNEILKKMTEVLAHRGPDSSGDCYLKTDKITVGLAHHRLSIIDLSEKGNQPIWNENKSVSMVFNGEIYNYKELTAGLKEKGHKFHSQTDTEVIIHLYEDIGDKCLDKLDGMFAFALWDQKNGRLLLARDRMGIKPAFYSFKNGNFYFASEIKALLRVGEITREIDYKSLDSYFTFGYRGGRTGTIFKDIKKLPPSSYLIFENQPITVHSYWAIKYLPKINPSEPELTEGLFHILERAVKRHLASDVPVGAFLSGGIDSSIIVALMSIVGQKTVDTFSLGYRSGGEDELPYAASVANRYKTNHHEFKIIPEMTKILPKLLWYLDEPFPDNSIIPTYYISKFAKEKVKVVLSGDGGDEMFGGYDWTRRYQYNVAYQMIVPNIVRRLLSQLGLQSSLEEMIK